MPRFIVALGILIGVFGFGGYLKSGSVASESKLVRQPKKFSEQPANLVPAAPVEKTASVSGNANISVPPTTESLSKGSAQRTEIRGQDLEKHARYLPEPSETVYYCGASTAKGTPCKHRVKGNVRCFQHEGMPALLPQGQLRIK